MQQHRHAHVTSLRVHTLYTAIATSIYQTPLTHMQICSLFVASRTNVLNLRDGCTAARLGWPVTICYSLHWLSHSSPASLKSSISFTLDNTILLSCLHSSLSWPLFCLSCALVLIVRIVFLVLLHLLLVLSVIISFWSWMLPSQFLTLSIPWAWSPTLTILSGSTFWASSLAIWGWCMLSDSFFFAWEWALDWYQLCTALCCGCPLHALSHWLLEAQLHPLYSSIQHHAPPSPCNWASCHCLICLSSVHLANASFAIGILCACLAITCSLSFASSSLSCFIFWM